MKLKPKYKTNKLYNSSTINQTIIKTWYLLIQFFLAKRHIDNQQTHKSFCFDSPNNKNLPNNKTKKCKQNTILEKNANLPKSKQ
jgi:hypothetical protein